MSRRSFPEGSMGTDIRPAIPAPSSVPATPAPDYKRRRFLFAIGAGGAAAATVAAGAAPAAAQVNTAVAQADDTASGYRVTEHVRDYYRTTKI
jgi:hypothetical protein